MALRDFAATIRATFGPAGDRWLTDLPAILAGAATRWRLTLGEPFALSYNYVTSATAADGRAVVLKVGVPCAELRSEIATLELYARRGMVRLLDADADGGLLLLERVLPGEPLRPLCDTDDDAATLITAEVLRTLRLPPPAGHSFRHVRDWIAGLDKLRPQFGGTTGPFPAALVDAAERTFAELLADSAPDVVLHGDLHHWNILQDGAGWVAIDPKGILGEPAYEVGALLRNPLPGLLELPDPARLTARRLTLLAEALGLDRQRLRGWGMAQAVLSAWWSYEDRGTGWRDALVVAEILGRC